VRDSLLVDDDLIIEHIALPTRLLHRGSLLAFLGEYGFEQLEILCQSRCDAVSEDLV